MNKILKALNFFLQSHNQIKTKKQLHDINAHQSHKHIEFIKTISVSEVNFLRKKRPGGLMLGIYVTTRILGLEQIESYI